MDTSHNEKPVIGASIVHLELPITPSKLSLGKKPSFDTISPCSSNLTTSEYPNTKEDDYDPISNSQHPFSAFYSHPTTRTSLEQAQSQSKIHIAVYQNDLESGSRITQAEAVPEVGYHHKEDDKVWPCAETLRKKKLAIQQKGRGCSPFKRLSKKQKIVVHTIIVILLIATITGLGVGISKAVGGGVFRTTKNSNAPIGNGN